MLFTLSLFFIEFSYFMRNVLILVWAKTKLQRGHEFLLKIFISLIKLVVSLPYPVLFKCSPLLFKQFPPIFLLSTASIFKVQVIINIFCSQTGLFPILTLIDYIQYYITLNVGYNFSIRVFKDNVINDRVCNVFPLSN